MQPSMHQQYPPQAEQNQIVSGFLASIPGQNDFEVLQNLKEIIKNGQHEYYRPVPQPAALARIYLGPTSSAHQPSLEHQYQQPPPPSSDTDIPGASTSIPDSGLNSSLQAQWESANDPMQNALQINDDHELGVQNVGAFASNGKPAVDSSNSNNSNAAELPPKPVTALQNIRAENGEAILLEPNDHTRDRASAPSLRDAPPLGDDRRRYDARGFIDDSARYAQIPPKDQRLYDRERERERERDFRPRDDRRIIPRPPPEERHYEPSYDRSLRRPDDKLPNDVYPPSSLRPYDVDPEMRPRPLNPDRHYRPDEYPPQPPAYTSDRYYRPDDRLYASTASRDHHFHADPPNIRPEYRPKSPDLHPVIGVSKVAEMAAANRKAQLAHSSPEEKTPKPSLIERLNPPPSLQERISDPTAASKPSSDDHAVNPSSLEERIAPSSPSVPPPRPDERTAARPANDTTTANISRPVQGETTRNGSVDISASASRASVERSRPEDDLARPQASSDKSAPPVSTRPSTYVRESSPPRSYRPAADPREVRPSNTYRPETEKGVYERPEYVNDDRYDPHHLPYVKRAPSPSSDRDRGRPIIPSAIASAHSSSRDVPGSYTRRLSPTRDRRDWEAYPAAYASDRNWRPDDYRRSYDTRTAIPLDKERYERDHARAAGWETRDERHASYRSKSPGRGAYDTYAPLPMSAPPPDNRSGYPSVPRDDRRFVSSESSRVRPRSPSPDLRRRPGIEDLRPPPKRVRDDAYSASGSYHTAPRPGNYPPSSVPLGGSYYPPGDGRSYSREYPPDYDRRSPTSGPARMPDYASRPYVPRDDRRYPPPPRTG